MVWIVGSFPDQVSKCPAQANRFCWRWVALPPCVDNWNVGAGSLPRPGEERESWVFVESFMPLICVIGKQIDLSYLWSYLPLSYLHIKYWTLDGSVRNLFTCLPLQKIELTKLWAQLGFFSSKDKWLCFECKDVSKSNDARQSHYLQRLQVHYCGDWWPLGQQHIRKTGKWRLGEWVCLLLLFCLPTTTALRRRQAQAAGRRTTPSI